MYDETTHWWHFLLTCSLVDPMATDGSVGVEGAEGGEERKELLLEN
jgi:hypothetical protein